MSSQAKDYLTLGLTSAQAEASRREHGSNVLTSKYIVSKAQVKTLPPTDEWKPFEMFFDDVAPVDQDVLDNFGYNLALVFSSSKRGAEFCGAVGSTLYIDKVVVSLERE